MLTPKYQEQTIVRFSNVRLEVLNPSGLPVIDQLFDSPTASAPIDQNAAGAFLNTNVKENKEVSLKIAAGDCSSSMGTARIKVAEETLVEIPNAFSPNGDG